MLSEKLLIPADSTAAIATLRTILAQESAKDKLHSIENRAAQIKAIILGYLTTPPFNFDINTAERILLQNREWAALTGSYEDHPLVSDDMYASARILVSTFLATEIKKLIKEVECT